ncbi:transcriptional regulator [Bacillus sp. FJAT-42376]|uniref:transcriptional regulator SplA domain-containing protein n=1 Tax=Bacillus sp. FJAT-42376 TaxID=2014076 RepID=UPI000F508912|nr:transcriptional regulator SplA domain-containing protein [Bacillus sp. FJAT-42376]AZB42597.1 transcriptional regulator [Bacillus sp. FJAT-42376]
MNRLQAKAGDTVYVIYRNPHTANVAVIKEAEVVRHPEDKNDVALFMYETYHELLPDDAVFSTYEEAEQLYNELFNSEQYEG